MKHSSNPTVTKDMSLRPTVSQKPQARYLRQRHLDPVKLDQDNEATNLRHRLKRHRHVSDEQASRGRRMEHGGWLERQVAHHLARGRDAGAIAVWCNVPVVRIQGVIARLQEAAA